jgi:hypothetical protein
LTDGGERYDGLVREGDVVEPDAHANSFIRGKLAAVDTIRLH